MSQHQANPDFFNFLAERRSASRLVEPKPDEGEVRNILKVAGTVPDHGALKPYRFVIIEGEGRQVFGESLLDAAAEHRPGGLEESLKAKIKAKALAAPLLIVIIFSPVASAKIPHWEQMASASCTGYAIDLAANALGFGAVWKNFAYEPGAQMKKILALTEGEAVLGWVNIGTDPERSKQSLPREEFNFARHALYLKS